MHVFTTLTYFIYMKEKTKRDYFFMQKLTTPPICRPQRSPRILVAAFAAFAAYSVRRTGRRALSAESCVRSAERGDLRTEY